MSALEHSNCRPCEGGIDPLPRHRIDRLLPQIPGWALTGDARAISRDFEFQDFDATMQFINVLAWLANAQDHHPDFDVAYDRCSVRWTTHAIDGLSENDFICAAKLNHIMDKAS